MAGLSIYKRNQGRIPRSVTAVVLVVFLAGLCYFARQKLERYVPAGQIETMAVGNADESWLLVDPWPDAEDPEYPAGTKVTAEVKKKLTGSRTRRGQEVRLRFKPADPYRYAIHVQLGVPVLFFVIGAFGIFCLVNGHKFADFLIATESEMKKVHWSSRAELIGSTVVVIVTVLILAAYIFGVDSVILKGLILMNVLPS